MALKGKPIFPNRFIHNIDLVKTLNVYSHDIQ